MSSTSIVVKCLESLRCVCLAVCTHPCLHAHLRGCVHAYIHTRISMYTCMCVPGCVYTSMFERSHAFNVCGWLRVHTHVCTHAYTHAPSHVYMHTHTHTSTHTHKHTSSCGGSLWDADPQNPCLTRSLWTHTHTHKICTQIFVLLWWVAAGLQDPCLARSLWTHTHTNMHTNIRLTVVGCCRSTGSMFGQITVGTLITQDVFVGIFFAVGPLFAKSSIQQSGAPCVWCHTCEV